MENMSNIQKLAKQALKTFRTTSTAPSKQNLDVLKAMVGLETIQSFETVPWLAI